MIANVQEWPYDYPQREWAQRCRERFDVVRSAKDDFTLGACPAAGKTKATCSLVARLLLDGTGKRVMVVSPTEKVQKQWRDAFSDFGIDLICEPVEVLGFMGCSVTYQQVASGKETHRINCGRQRTIVVLDEIHHLGENLAWGAGCRRAFEGAAFRIHLSGTLFRSKSEKIPFIDYLGNTGQTDFSYSYQQALDDKVCRPAFFQTMDGGGQWLINGDMKQALLGQKLNEKDTGHLLRTILAPSGDWIRATALASDRKLMDCRALGHRNAGTLWLCTDQNHVKALAPIVASIAGEEPVRAISEDPKASEKIAAFASGTQKNLLSVRQVSEGADLPRLRCLVYATNYMTELFFRQALGRIIRMILGLEEQWAYFFLPRLPTLVEYSLRVLEEIYHHLEEEADGEIKQIRAADGQLSIAFPSLLEPISSFGQMGEVIGHGQPMSQYSLSEARRFYEQIPDLNQPLEAIALALIRSGLIRAGSSGETVTAEEEAVPKEVYRNNLRVKIEEKVKSLASIRGGDPGETKKAIHTEWLKHGGKATPDASVEDLEAKYMWLLEEIANAQRRQGWDES